METILFSFILILIIIWIMLGILYFYMRYVSPYGILIKKNKKGNEQTKENEVMKEKDGQKGEGKEDQAEFVLIGKSRSISPIIPQVPSTSSSENSEQNSNNFGSSVKWIDISHKLYKKAGIMYLCSDQTSRTWIPA